MKPRFLLALIFFQLISSFSNAQITCGSPFDPAVVKSADAARYNRYVQMENFITSYKQKSNARGALINANSTITIPVVIHVLHNGEAVGAGSNISDAKAQSQIAVLNEDFRRLNADRVNTPAAFTGVAADPNVEFRLTCVDPNGAATNGIHRVRAGVNTFTIVYNSDGSPNETASRVKFTAQGGTDAWPTDRYLNIWVCNITANADGSQLLGYAQFPFDYAAKPNTDGVVILNNAFGRVGALRFQYDRGRTTTHEVGHWLNLFHIWGDDGTACTGSDQCNDTPNQAGANQSNCPGFPHITCANGPNGDMFMNYMDYTVDGCKNIYTRDQTARMRATFATGGARSAFINNYFHINQNVQPVCTTGQFTVTNLACLPVTWSVVSGPVTIQSGQGTNTVTLQRSGTSSGTAVIQANAGGYFDQFSLAVGLPPAPTNLRLSDVTCPEYTFNCDYISPNTYSWSYYNTRTHIQTNVPGNGARARIVFTTNDTYNVGVTTTNACGTSNISFITVAVTCSTGGGGGHRIVNIPSETNLSLKEEKNKVKINGELKNITVYPNPGDDFVTININSLNKENNLKGIKNLSVYNLSGKLMKTLKYDGLLNKVTLLTSDFIPGVYIIKISDNKTTQSKKLIISR